MDHGKHGGGVCSGLSEKTIAAPGKVGEGTDQRGVHAPSRRQTGLLSLPPLRIAGRHAEGGHRSMEQRYLKMALAFAVGLLATLWFANNLLNWEMARGAVIYTLSQQD